MTNLDKVQIRDAFFRAGRFFWGTKKYVILSVDFGAISTDELKVEFPNLFINCGISEQNVISVAAGLSKSNFIPIVYSIATFITSRSFEQVKLDLGVMNLPAILIGVGSGYSYSYDGPTHHATEDIALMRLVPNMQIISISNPYQAALLGKNLDQIKKLTYVRMDRESVLHPKIDELNWNDFYVRGYLVHSLRTDILIITTGNTLSTAMSFLKTTSYICGLLEITCISEEHKKYLAEYMVGVKKIIIIEEQQMTGGLGSYIQDIQTEFNLSCEIKKMGIMKDKLKQYGNREAIRTRVGIDFSSLDKCVRSFLGE